MKKAKRHAVHRAAHRSRISHSSGKQNWFVRFRYVILGTLGLLVVVFGGLNYLAGNTANTSDVLGVKTNAKCDYFWVVNCINAQPQCVKTFSGFVQCEDTKGTGSFHNSGHGGTCNNNTFVPPNGYCADQKTLNGWRQGPLTFENYCNNTSRCKLASGPTCAPGSPTVCENNQKACNYAYQKYNNCVAAATDKQRITDINTCISNQKHCGQLILNQNTSTCRSQKLTQLANICDGIVAGCVSRIIQAQKNGDCVLGDGSCEKLNLGLDRRCPTWGSNNVYVLAQYSNAQSNITNYCNSIAPTWYSAYMCPTTSLPSYCMTKNFNFGNYTSPKINIYCQNHAQNERVDTSSACHLSLPNNGKYCATNGSWSISQINGYCSNVNNAGKKGACVALPGSKSY